MIRKFTTAVSAMALALLQVAPAAAGGFATPGFPVVGSGGSSAYQGLTGVEQGLFDTLLPGGQNPQSIAVPVSLLGNSTNRLIGGDFQVNLAQRLSTTKGIASLAGFSPTAAVMTADGWWAYSTGSQVTVTMDTSTTAAVPALGTTQALRVARPSGQTPSGAICLGQTLDQAQSAPLIGNNAVFSFWELNGSTMSAAGGNITAQISYSSASAAAATQATLGYAGSQGSKYAIGTNAATFGTSGPTNQTAAVPVLVGTTGTVGANGFVTIPGSTTWTRYAISAPIPATIPGGTTPVTDVSVEVCFLPTATTAVTTDWIELQGLQLEAKPAGVTAPTALERRTAAVEAAIDLSYWYYNFENQSLITAVANCIDQSVTVAQCNIQFPVPMKIVPNVKLTSGFQIFTTTGYSAVNACTLAVDGTYSLVPSNAGTVVQCTATTVPAAGTANILTTLGTSSATGIISASALP